MDDTLELETRRWYSSRYTAFYALEQWIVKNLAEFCLQDKNIYASKTRIKTIDSVLAKLARKLEAGAPCKDNQALLEQFDDLVAARLLVYHPSKILKLHEHFCSEVQRMKIVEMTIHSHQHDPNFAELQKLSYESDVACTLLLNNTGYSGFHYVMQPVLLDSYFSANYQDSSGARPFEKFELQVRTVIQETWSEVQHRLIYKSLPGQPAFVPKLQSQFANLARMLNLCDNMLDTLCEPRQFAPSKVIDARRVGPEYAALLNDIHRSLTHFERNNVPMAERYQEAESLFAQYQQEIGLYSMAITEKTLGINLELSEYFLKSGHYQEALSLFQKMEQVSSEDPWIYFRAAESCSHQPEQINEGKRYIEKLYRLLATGNSPASSGDSDDVLYHHAALLAVEFELAEIADFFASKKAS